MMNRRFFYSFLAVVMSVFFMTSCETDVELLAPYDETPVIYGILDYTADTQYVRINKTFLGEGDPAQYAAIPDSVDYNPEDVDAIIYKYNDDGNLIDSFPLGTVRIPSREPGIFYEQDVLFYFTDEQLLTEDEQDDQSDFLFELKATIKGETYTADTRFPGLDVSTIARPFTGGATPQKYAFATAGLNQNFTSGTFAFSTDQFSASYAASVRLNFDYTTTDGQFIEDQFIDIQLGTFNNPELRDGILFNITLFGENLYTFWASQLDLIPDLAEVQIEDLDFRVVGATPEFSTYLDVAQPVSQFTPVLNSYTNISNGGIGIFSSVATQTRDFWLDENSLRMLTQNEITNKYSYCVQGWSGSNYLCDE